MRDGASLNFCHFCEFSIGEPLDGALRDREISKVDFKFAMELLFLDELFFFLCFL